MTDDTPKHIGAYDIVATVGKGSLGTVYKAVQSSKNRTVAIKVLPSRFHSEVHAVAILNHPNIVQIIDKGQDGEVPYFVMEYIEGVSLDTILRQRRLSLQEALKIMHALCLGLQAAHDAGVVHRDLNPRNVLVNPSFSVVKIADFGISRVEALGRSAGGTIAGMSVGHIHYLAPEQARNPANIDPRSDVYASGAVFYEMLTGRLPLGRFSLPSQLNSELPSDIDPIVLKCLEDDPNKRYASIAKLREDVDRLEERMRFQLVDELRGIHRSTTKLFGGKGKGLSGAAIGLIVLAVILLGAGVAFLVTHKQGQTPEASAPPTAHAAPVQAPGASTPVTSGDPTPPSSPAPAAPPATPAASAPSPSSPAPAPAKTPAKTPAKAPIDAAESKASAAEPAAAKSAPEPAVEPKAAAKAGTAAFQRDLDVARSKIDAKLYDQALADLTAIMGRNPDPEIALAADYLIARAQLAKGQSKEALSTYVEIETRFKNTPASAEAWYDHAQVVQGPGTDKSAAEDARRIYDQLASAFPQSPWTVKGLVAKSELEKRLKIFARDSRLEVVVPAALISLRTLTDAHPTDPAAENAFWQLGQMYDDLKHYDLAAAAYSSVGANFPATRLDAWFEAGQLFERRLKDPAKAKAAYLKVPATSQNYKEAQKRAEKIKN